MEIHPQILDKVPLMICLLRSRLLSFTAAQTRKRPVLYANPASDLRALGGTRTPNLLIRSQMLYPLSYERGCRNSLWHSWRV